jgi:hypothetical protein
VSGLNRDAARRWWPLALGVLLGVLAGVLVSLLGSGTRRAEASVLISSPAGPSAVTPMLPNLRELATSGVVAANVRSTLRLKKSTQELRRHLHATVRPQSEVVAISATDEVADHARQVAQEAAVVFAQLVDARFGTGEPALHAAVLDSAHVLGGTDRELVRNGLIGALVGLLLGSASMFVLASGSRQVVAAGGWDDQDLSEREGLLEQRVRGVTARERALAERAGKLAAREQELDERAAKLTAAEREVASRAGEVASSQRELADRVTEIAASKRELEALAPPPPPPAPGAAPAPGSAPEPEARPALGTRAGTWNLNEIQRAVDAHIGSVTPDQANSWRTYLYFIREHASPDGTLPRSLDPLIADVFAEILR